MVETRLPEEILHEIEEDLRHDQDLWKHIHTDLHALGAPSARRPRTRWIALGAVASLVALFAAFALGWQVAPETSEEVAVTRVVTVAPLPGIAEDKYETIAELGGVPQVAAPGDQDAYVLSALTAQREGGQYAQMTSPTSAERFRVAWIDAKAEALAS